LKWAVRPIVALSADLVCQLKLQPVVYYSGEGHTRSMAEAVARAARSIENVEVKLLSVAEAKIGDVLSADAIIIGSPVYNANMAPPVQEFINRWPFEGAPLRDNLGAAFVSAGGPEWTSSFGASAVTMEEPFRPSQDGRRIDDHFLKKAEGLGRRVAELAVKWKRVR
jgi:NAD(P)H dehydrogenase (quinone)